MIVGRLMGWVVVLAGLAVLVRDGLLWFDTGRWLPLALADLWHGGDRLPGIVLALWVSALLIGPGAALALLCRRRPLRRRFSRRSS